MTEGRWVRFDWPLTGRTFPSADTPDYRLRSATPTDVEAMLAVVGAAYASDPVWRELTADIESRVGARIRESVSDPSACFVVAERGLHVVGLSGVALRHPTGQHLVTGICVTPEHQGRGLGTALLSASLAWLRDQCLATATVTTDARSVAARVYQQFGATRTDGVSYPGAPRAR